MARPRRSSIERQLDEAIARWIEQGLVQATDWKGAPLMATRLPTGRHLEFNADAVERVLRFFLLLRQTIGRWAGQQFILLDWQVRWIIGPIFGIRHKATGYRVIRTVWVEIPRKNGKSTLCSGLGLYLFMADREPGAQVYAAAGDRAQAGLVFNPSRLMAIGSPDIAKKLGKGIKRGLLEHPITGAIFRALSSDGARQHGLNIHGAVIDEVHVHKTPDLIDALETGVGSRTQPLVLFITTADEGRDGSVYNTKREYFENVAAGTVTDPTFYGVLFGADQTAEGFDPFSEATLRDANPGADVTVMMDYLLAKAAEAKASPAQLNRYLRLHLNIRTKQAVRWLPIDRYDATGQPVADTEWAGQIVRGGLDLSSTTDFTAYAVRGTDTENGHPVRLLAWIPEERLEDLQRLTMVPLSQWVRAGWLRLTEGNVVDYAKVRADIQADAERLGYKIGSIGYDPWNATETVQQLEAAGVQMVPIRQSYGQLSSPTKSLERLVLGSTPDDPLIRTGGNPVLRWMVDCVEVKQDESGNVKPVKPDRAKSSKRIDGVVALIMAEREAMATDDGPSAFDSYMATLMQPCPSCGTQNAKVSAKCSKCEAPLGAAV